MKAGKLRHRITIESVSQVQDPDTGDMSDTWAAFASNVPASIRPLSGRELVAADAIQSGSRYEFVIRYGNSVGVTSAMRIALDSLTYNITEIVPDPSLRDHVLIRAEAGISG